MKKPVFADVADLIGGLLEDELKKKKKSKRSYAQSKYPKFIIQAPPAPARLPFVLPPPAPAGVRLGRPPGRRAKTPLDLAREDAIAVGFAHGEALDAQAKADDEALEAKQAYDRAVKAKANARTKRPLERALQSARDTARNRAMDVAAMDEDVAAAGDRIAKAQAAVDALAARGERIAPRAAAEEPAAAEVVTPARKAPRKKRGKKSPEVLFPAAAEPAAEEAGLVPLFFGMGRFLGRFE
jgi:hypothetical protein